MTLLLALLLQVDRDGLEFFEQKIRPVLVERCYKCHGAEAEKVKGGLLLDTRDGLLKGGDDGPVLAPGDPAKSRLILAVRWTDPDFKMPPKEKLQAAQIADLEAWVKRGAPDPRTGKPISKIKPPWSLEPLKSSKLDSIDAFIDATLAAKGLKPAPPADRRTLLRRVTFDLTGLPPGEDDGADYEQVVDRLLASPRYGERWGRHWLDTVHFGETHGYDKDKPRPNAWPYRDYVIRALNEDMPYPRFVREQLAGDLLGPSTVVATGFIAAGPWDFVGHVELPETKTDGLIARYNDRDDMLMTAMSTFASLTVHCARCHDHKFDPIAQEDYYALQAVFAGVDRADRTVDLDPAVAAKRRELEGQPGRPKASPTNGYHSAISRERDVTKWVQVDLGEAREIDEIRLIPARPTDFADTPGFGFPARYAVEVDGRVLVDRSVEDEKNPGDKAVVLPIKGPVRLIRVTATRLWERTKDYVFALGELQAFSKGENVALRGSVTALDSIEAGRWAKTYLVDGYSSRASLDTAAEGDRRAQIEKELAALPVPLKVYAAPPRSPRTIHVLARGDVKKPLKEAVPGAPSCVAGLASRFEAGPEGARRMALADWLTDPKNVLARRSIVNRVWHHHFGRGIVETPNDFGNMGASPTHPELLDWLALRFTEEGGSLKKLHRLIVTSATYRRSSKSEGANAAIDADNRFLWRMNRSRLDAESFHDALLAVSGRLDPAMGGPSVQQFRFKDDHSPVYDYSAFDVDSPGARRRSVYRFVVRSVPDPFMEALDGADPSILTPRRNTTITALQALATLNDPFVLKQCEHFAARAKSIEAAWRLALGRDPRPEEVKLMGDYAARHGLAAACRLIVNSNEFWFVD